MKFRDTTLEKVNAFSKNTLMEHLGITCIEIGDDFLVSTMPVNTTTHQPMGMLHGGASVALIESVGSLGSSLLIDLNKEYPVGLEVNANHIGSIQSGTVKAIGKIVHAGKRTHVWQVEVTDMETAKMICIGRLTVMIVQRS
jgi:1,4-dihydroxy-2-naphthoyl-CoA hydrolase